MNSGSELPAQITFGRFRLMPHRREILLEDQPIRLGSRAFDVLMALIEARGSVVSKDDLMARVWPNQMVEENNLEVQVSTLRAVLGAERALIRTVSRRGYQFTGELRFPPENVEVQANIGPETNLPQPVSKLIGRDDDLDEILRLAAAQRLVTLTGTGGIGKTRLALSVGQRLLPQFGDGVWLVELAPLTDPGLLPTAVAAAIGLELVDGTVTAERVASALTGKELVLLLDNCEHQLDAAALIAEALLRANRSALVIATSREPLRVEGEQIYPVPPLSVPAATIGDNTDTLEYAAVQLFVEKARAAKFEFAPDERSMAMLAAICRRLDGIPLAIELAAARVAALGIEELNVRLDECLSLLTGGRRTALPRQQTLRATLDWSYRLLPESERVLLRRLAIFAGQFSLEAAATVAASLDLSELDTIDCLSNLVAKSLVVRDVKSAIARYRLLDTTRAYALEKLGESAERERIARRHAEYYRDLFERAETEWRVRPAAEWLGEYAWRIDNLRAALDWAFSADGDATLGVALTVAAIPLWMHLSLLEECRGRLEKALAALRPGANRDARREMKLHAALAALHTGGAVSETGAAWTKTLEIAESLEDPEYQLRALWGLWFFHTASSRHRVALDLAQRLCTLAERWPDPNDRLIGERAMSTSQHYLGHQSNARRHIERVLADYVIADARPHLIRFQIDLRVMARVFFARVLWLQGFPDEAMRAAERSVEDARAANHAISLCYALFLGACPIALSVGDLVAAEHYVSMLLDHSTRFALTFWANRGRSYQGALFIKRGDVDIGLPLLRAGFDEVGEARSTVLGLIELLIPEALGRAGQIAEGLAAIEEAINHSENTEERWMIAEMLRIKGELRLLQGGPTVAAAAEDHFRQALDWAARQGALSWELRAAMSLARLLRDQGRQGDASACLRPVYDRFTEGFGTADLKAAKALLDSGGG
jgi:predicted ATPase/DNA-binding winged helix-turn-helix (wHTH) protein